MSQFGMQLSGGRGKRSASLDVYTALAFIAVVFLATACVLMWVAGSKVGVDGGPFNLQKTGSISLKKAN